MDKPPTAGEAVHDKERCKGWLVTKEVAKLVGASGWHLDGNLEKLKRTYTFNSCLRYAAILVHYALLCESNADIHHH